MAHIHELIDFTVAAYIIHKNTVLLIHHKKLGKWLPVGGHVELDEDTDQAIAREIEEECGLKVKMYGSPRKQFTKGLKPLNTPKFIDIHKINAEHRHLNLVYFAYSKNNKVNLAKLEHTDIKWFTKEELYGKKYKILPDVKFYATEALKLLGKWYYA